MRYYIGLDGHKRYSEVAVMDERGEVCERRRIGHCEGALREYFSQFGAGTPVAMETMGNWYWMVDEMEAAGCEVHLAHAQKAKVMMGHVDKTDKLDARGLAMLLRLGSLPEVWIPCGELRDQRELPRTRMVLSRMGVRLKNRLHATLGKYNLRAEVSDLFGVEGRRQLERLMVRLPAETKRCVEGELAVLDEVEARMEELERRIGACVQETPTMQVLKSLPGVGKILAIVIEREVGDIGRFRTAERFAGYSGTVPKVEASGGKVRYGRLRKACNTYLKWAYIEAANAVVRHHRHPRWQRKHVVRLYHRIAQRKGHDKAVGALARHLAEATYWILQTQQVYREPVVRARADPTAARSCQSRGKRALNMSSEKDGI